MNPPYLEMAIEHHGDTVGELRDRIASLDQDVAAYRALACAALDQLALLTRTVQRSRAQHMALREEYARVRASIMRADDARRQAAA